MPSNRRGSGIRKRQRRDRDGDLVMGAAPRVSPARPQKGPSTTNGNLTELRVTGWTEEPEIPRLIQFLERHSSRRSPNATRAGVPPTMVKRSRVTGDVLTIHVRPEDVGAFGKINGFSFMSLSRGGQKLTITGPGIKSSEPPAVKEETSKTIDLFKAFLERRYVASEKLLNLSNISADEEVAKSGMFDTGSRQNKFFPVLMTICDRQLKTEEQKRDAIHSITLSNNNLPNLSLVQDVAITLPHIKNLDLSNNKFSSTKDLHLWKNKFRSLEHLILKDNPLETSQPEWEREIIKWFPRLRLLNGQQVRTDAQIARLDMPKQTPAPCQNGLWLDGDKIAENFLLEFFHGFDNDRNTIVQKYYDNTSVFSLNVNAKAKGGAGDQHDRTPWDAYLPLSRNLKFINNRRTRFSRKHRGPEQIQRAWSNIPPTRHSGLGTNKYSMDCQPQPGLPDPSGQYSGVTGLMVTIHGEYEEHRTAKGANEIVRRAFNRTFLLGPGGPSGVRVVSDILCLSAGGGLPAWIPHGPTEPPAQPIAPAADILTPEQEGMVIHVCQATNLKRDVAMQCLQAGNWSLEAAAQLFTAQKDSLPPEAFN